MSLEAFLDWKRSLEAFLDGLKLSKHQAVLEELGYDDVDDYGNMDDAAIQEFESELKGKGVPAGHVGKLSRAVKAARGKAPAAGSPEPEVQTRRGRGGVARAAPPAASKRARDDPGPSEAKRPKTESAAAKKKAAAAEAARLEAALAAAKKKADAAAKKEAKEREKERKSKYLVSPAKGQVDAAKAKASELGTGPPNSILFACVKDGKKPYPRVRVVGYFNSRGALRVGAYDSSLNVQFPRNIRQEGKLLIAPQDCLKMGGKPTAPFYVVKAEAVQEYFENPFGSSPADIARLEATTVFEMSECVICLGERPAVMILPCGHLCMCRGCSARLKASNDKRCPLCRQDIQNTYEGGQ